MKLSADPRNSAHFHDFLVIPEINVNLRRTVKGYVGGGGYFNNYLTHRNGSPIKICRISQGNAWESFENCVFMTNNGKYLGKIYLT